MENSNLKWFLVQCFSGKELDVKMKIEQKIEAEEMSDFITEVYVPLKNKTRKNGDLVIRKNLENGEKFIAKAVKFSGYLFVKMDQLSDEAWFLIRNTEGVNGLIGSSGKGTKPTPVSEAEINKYKIEEENLPKYNEVNFTGVKLDFKVGDVVEVVSGPYETKVGKVISIDTSTKKCTINIESFGRSTPTSIDIKDVKPY
ncbi:MAG: KOW motif-containing protein [Mycoplasmataceae bacterium]|nr:KOW motif-containing protein [Mycoplasmataceae bacterium]